MPYLVHLVPAILVLAAHTGMLMQQKLTAVGVAAHDGRVVQGREAIAVLVVGGGPELQQRLARNTKLQPRVSRCLGDQVR